MVEGSGDFGFAGEAFVGLGIFAEMDRQEFEGDESVELGVISFTGEAVASKQAIPFKCGSY